MQSSMRLQQHQPQICRQTECRIRQLHKQSSSRAVRVAAAAGPAADPVQGQQPEQAAVEQRSVTLRKPVGVVFAQNKTGPVFVEELTAGGNADKSGLVQVGDVLSQCSAVVLKAGKEGQYEREGYGQRPYDNWETIMFDCENQEFKTVMSALKSNNERWGFMNVTLVFRRPSGPQEAALCTKSA